MVLFSNRFRRDITVDFTRNQCYRQNQKRYFTVFCSSWYLFTTSFTISYYSWKQQSRNNSYVHDEMHYCRWYNQELHVIYVWEVVSIVDDKHSTGFPWSSAYWRCSLCYKNISVGFSSVPSILFSNHFLPELIVLDDNLGNCFNWCVATTVTYAWTLAYKYFYIFSPLICTYTFLLLPNFLYYTILYIQI